MYFAHHDESASLALVSEREDLAMADGNQIHVQPNDDGDFVISRDGMAGQVVLTGDHIINLAQALPRLAAEILRERHAPKSPGASIAAYTPVKQFGVFATYLGDAVLLQLKDPNDSTSTFGFPAAHAHEIGSRLVAKAEELLNPSKASPQ